MRAAVVALLLLPVVARAGGELVVGMSAPFTGPSRGLGIEFYRGASAYFSEVNATGGVHKRQLRVVARDDAYEQYRRDPSKVNEYIDKQKDYNDVVEQYRNTLIEHRQDMLQLNTAVGTRIMP